MLLRFEICRVAALAAWIALAVPACKSGARVTRPRPESMPVEPRVVAVARPAAQIGETIEVDRLLAEEERALEALRVSFVPNAVYQPHVAATARDAAAPTDVELAAAAKQSEADAVLVLDVARYGGGSFILLTHRALRGRARLLQAGTGAVLWEAQLAEQELDGPGQDVELVVATVFWAFGKTDREAKARVFHHFAATLGKSLAETWPALMQRPVDSELAVDSPLILSGPRDASWGSGDYISVQVRGTPRRRAEALLPGVDGAFPLTEAEPGLYRGTIRILPGMGDVYGPVSVRLCDRFHRYVGKETSQQIAISAPPLPGSDDSLVRTSNAASERHTIDLPRESVFTGRRSAVPAYFTRDKGSAASRPAVPAERP